MPWTDYTTVTVTSQGAVDRRTFLRFFPRVGAGVAGLLSLLGASAGELARRRKSCILLWMGGGPSQFESFDPKDHPETGGGTRTIATSLPGVPIAEYWPRTATQMRELVLIRSMVGREGSHQRATYHLHTGYSPSGSVVHPSLGAHVVRELAPPESNLPQFVSIGGPTQGAGFLGAAYEPFVVEDPQSGPADLTAGHEVDQRRRARRLAMLATESDLNDPLVFDEYLAVQQQALRMAQGPARDVFDLSREPTSVVARYGTTRIGMGCLLARRLVEAGVTFVEVRMTGWDTHRDNFTITPRLAAMTDAALASLVVDLKQRGLLDHTLLIWMGEFGRTPRINPKGGRDHWPQAFSILMAGAGLPSGVVLGKTSPDGSEVVDRPVTVPDLFRTICTVLGVDPDVEHTSPLGRPIKTVDGGEVIRELVG